MTLSPAEKLQANSGPWSNFIKEIEQQLSLPESRLLDVIKLNLKRAAGFGNVARLIYVIYLLSNENSRPRPPSPSALTAWVNRKVEPTKQFKDRVLHVMQVYEGLAADDDHGKAAFCSTFELDPNNASSRTKSKFSPVEFVLTGLLIALHPYLHLYRLAQAIREFRTELHKKFTTDKKFNQKVFDLFWKTEEKLGDEGKERMGEKRKHDDVHSDSEVEDGEEYEPPLNMELEISTDRRTRGGNAEPAPKRSRHTSSSKPSSSHSVVTPISQFQDLDATRATVFGPPTGALAKR